MPLVDPSDWATSYAANTFIPLRNALNGGLIPLNDDPAIGADPAIVSFSWKPLPVSETTARMDRRRGAWPAHYRRGACESALIVASKHAILRTVSIALSGHQSLRATDPLRPFCFLRQPPRLRTVLAPKRLPAPLRALGVKLPPRRQCRESPDVLLRAASEGTVPPRSNGD